MPECPERLSLEQLEESVGKGKLAGTNLLRDQGGCRLAAKDMLVNPPYCVYPDLGYDDCPVARRLGSE